MDKGQLDKAILSDQKDNHDMIICNNGMKVHMPMMAVGGTTTWDIMDKTCSSSHNNLHYERHTLQRQQTMHQQSSLSLEYIVKNQL